MPAAAAGGFWARLLVPAAGRAHEAGSQRHGRPCERQPRQPARPPRSVAPATRVSSASAARGSQRPLREAPPALRLASPRLPRAAERLCRGQPAPSVAEEGRGCFTVELPAAPFPSSAAAPAAASRRGAGARCVTWSSAALPVRASSNGSAPAGPRRPISWRLVPLPRSFSERIQRRLGKLPVRARPGRSPRLASPAPQPRRSPHARGRGLYLSYLGGWLRSRERGGRKAELPVALVLPSRAFTHTFTCTDLKVQFRQGDGGTGKRGESSLDQTCHKRRTSK